MRKLATTISLFSSRQTCSDGNCFPLFNCFYQSKHTFLRRCQAIVELCSNGTWNSVRIHFLPSGGTNAYLWRLWPPDGWHEGATKWPLIWYILKVNFKLINVNIKLTAIGNCSLPLEKRNVSFFFSCDVCVLFKCYSRGLFVKWFNRHFDERFVQSSTGR